MSRTKKTSEIISHHLEPETIENAVNKIAARIKQEGDKPHVTVKRQLELLKQLQQFDLGRFLIQNQGLDGYWIDYILTHPWHGKKTGKNNMGDPLSALEKIILEELPILHATQQRFLIFLRENQKAVKNGTTLAVIPSGKMGEVLYLNYENISQIKLIGIDLDPNTLNDARVLAEEKGLSNFIQIIKHDAWEIDFHNELDLISCNGLTIYEPDNNRVIHLFEEFYEALKPGGKLVTSFLTFPPTLTDQCEWNMSAINPEDLAIQRILFKDIIQVKWQCFRSSAQTQQQLESVGFKNIEFIYDDARIFPTVTAIK